MENLSPGHPWGFKWLIKVIPQEKSYQTIFFQIFLKCCQPISVSKNTIKKKVTMLVLEI